MKNNLVKVTKDIWENDIREEMNKWEAFSESGFCKTKEDKDSVLRIIERLHETLETLLQENGLTEEQIEWFLYMA